MGVIIIVVDMDGTLSTEDKVILESSKEILNNYHSIISRVDIMNSEMYNFYNVNEAIVYLSNHESIHINIYLNDYKQSHKLADTLKNQYEDLCILFMQDSDCELQRVDILSKECNKGTNVKRLIEYLNINLDDTICFGDAHNDIEMLKSVKISVAMGNALPEVKSVATHVTGNHNDDGIYKFLNNYFFEKEK